MIAWLRKLLHIKTSEDAVEELKREPGIRRALYGLQRVDRILIELEHLEGKRR
jgi:hypothetical protein